MMEPRFTGKPIEPIDLCQQMHLKGVIDINKVLDKHFDRSAN
jgi:hypothetical protein